MEGTVSLYSIAVTLNELACMTRELARAQIGGATLGGTLTDIEARASEIELRWSALAEAFCPNPLPYDVS
jgi:hypothetical protein